ncbi:MAG: glycerate kinase [Verrucomicrobiota bacterium]
MTLLLFVRFGTAVVVSKCMQILLAFDKFKGTLTASEACRAASAGLARALPDARLESLPVADGGDGTLEVIASVLKGQRHRVTVENAVSTRQVEAEFLLTDWDGDRTAILEMASASGLALLENHERNPLTASTYGTGQLMLAALERGAEHLIIGLGGSASNDCGLGMAEACGFKFVGEDGEEVLPLPSRLTDVRQIQVPADRIPCRVTALIDVDNPLLGPTGATRVFGPQKGVTPEMVSGFDRRFEHLVDLLNDQEGAALPGSGAAGGSGFGLRHFFGARLERGFPFISDLLGLRQRVEKADLVVVGEGMLDGQTLSGKAPAGIGELARTAGKPVIAVGGAVDPDARKALETVFTSVYGLTDSIPTEKAMNFPSESLEEFCRVLGEQLAAD